jgi:Aminoglycoside-2''-adenylyltransferase
MSEYWWEPAPLPEVAAAFAGFPGPWWIAGGYALELAAGAPYRDHADIDVLLLRRDQLAAHAVLPGWELWAADPPGTLRPWPAGETLPATVHDIWCRERADGPWRVQLMLDESDGADWVSRRDAAVRGPVADLGRLAGAIPYLRPEVQLYYKATSATRRPKDELDFVTVAPLLDPGARSWLADRLPAGHPWRERL